MINNIDTIAQISLQYSRKMKRMFWESSSLTSAIQHWFERISPSILLFREQIRVLSVYSGSPENDQAIISILTRHLNRYRYVIVEPGDPGAFESEFSRQRKSSTCVVELSPYPHFLTFETFERFDLIFLFDVPINSNACESVIRKGKSLLRVGGQICLFSAQDTNLLELIRLLQGSDDPSSSVPSFLPSKQDAISAGKDSDSDRSPTACGEALATCNEALKTDSPAMEIAEQTPPAPRKEGMEQRRYESYLTSDSFVRLVLTDFELCFKTTLLEAEMDIAECFRRSRDGLMLLSGLLKIDLTGAIDSLVSEILDVLSLKTKPGTTRIPYNFSIYTIYSDLIAEVIHRSPNPTPTPWFPEGETGPFVNVGEQRWKKSLEEWRAAENEEPVKKMSISSIEGVVETIADDTLRRNKLPEPVNLDELLPLCDETWKYRGNH